MPRNYIDDVGIDRCAVVISDAKSDRGVTWPRPQARGHHALGRPAGKSERRGSPRRRWRRIWWRWWRRLRRMGGIPGGAGGLSIGTILMLGLIGYATGIDPGMLISGVETFNRQQPQVQQPQCSRSAQARARRRKTRPAASSPASSAAPKPPGRTSSPRRAEPIVRRSSCSTIGVTQANCGGRADARMGPFYCPADHRIYLDTSFFQLIERRFKGCDVGSQACRFAQAYVIAHEVGHHVQNLLGILQRSQQMQRNARSKADANRIQVRVELQADCFAGIWAKRNESRLEPGDIEAALRTAAAIGDDALAAAVDRAAWCRTRSPTARPSSASAGSTSATSRARSAPATRSRRRRSSERRCRARRSATPARQVRSNDRAWHGGTNVLRQIRGTRPPHVIARGRGAGRRRHAARGSPGAGTGSAPPPIFSPPSQSSSPASSLTSARPRPLPGTRRNGATGTISAPATTSSRDCGSSR